MRKADPVVQQPVNAVLKSVVQNLNACGRAGIHRNMKLAKPATWLYKVAIR